MAISWGPWEYSGGNGMRVGIEIEGWTEGDGAGAVNHFSAQAQTWVGYYTENQYSYSDSQTLNLSGAIDGTKNFSNTQGGAPQRRDRRLYEYNYGANEYGSSPGNRTFTVKLTGAFNGVTPSKSVTTKIPARPYWAPEKPTNVSVSRINDDSQKVTWKNNETSGKPYDSLQIDRETNNSGSWSRVGSTGGNATSFTDNTTIPDREYQYRVRAVNTEGTSSWEASNSIWTTPDAPTNAVRTQSGSDQVLTWNNNVQHNDHEVRVYRAVAGSGSWSLIATLPEWTETYTDVAPDPATSWEYRVRNVNTLGSPILYSDYSNITSASTGATSPPNAPTGLSPKDILVNPTESITLSWTYNSTDGTAQESYEIRWREAGSSTWVYIARVYTASTSHVVAANTFPNETDVEWEVRTWGADASPSVYSTAANFSTTGNPNAVRETLRPVVLNTTTGEMQTAALGVLPPVGAVTMFGGQADPPGWLICDGREVPQADYENLFAVIGTTFNNGTETTGYFRLPNPLDRAPVGASATKPLGATGGSDTKTIAVGNLPAHEHGMNHDHGSVSGDGGHHHDKSWRENASGGGPQDHIMASGGAGGTVVAKPSTYLDSGQHSHNVPSYTGTTQGGAAQGLNGEALDVQNPFIAFNFIIKH